MRRRELHGWHACCEIAGRGKVYSQILVSLSGVTARITWVNG
jgi:hypothetical protein